MSTLARGDDDPATSASSAPGPGATDHDPAPPAETETAPPDTDAAAPETPDVEPAAQDPEATAATEPPAATGRPEDVRDQPEIMVDRSAVRRAPRFGRFAAIGGLLGIVVAFAITPLAQFEGLSVPWHFDPWGLALVLAVMLMPVGVLAGCVVALLLDRRSRRRRD